MSLKFITHPVVQKYFQVLEVHQELKQVQEFSYEKVGLWPIHVFCNILGRISSFVLLNVKFCNKNLLLDWFSIVLIVSRILHCMCNFYKGSSIA